MQHIISVIGGQVARVQISGSYFLLFDMGASTSLEVTLRKGTYPLESVTTTKKGLKMRGSAFDLVELRSDVDADVTIVISDGQVDIDLFDGAEVLASIQGLPLQVSNDRGTPGNLLYVSAVTINDAPATAISEPGAVAVTDVSTPLVAANANRRALRFVNLDPANDVAITAPGTAWASRAIVLQPGDVFTEDRGANLAWSAICDTGLTASVGVQEITA